LKIVTTICDQGRQPNQAAINILLKESDKERGQQSRRRIITVENQSIIPLYDPPHLIKGIRNNLLTKNLIWEVDGEILTAKWKHITKTYHHDEACGELRPLHKITDLHVIPEKIAKMKVCYATQVLSHSMASTIALLVRSGNFLKNSLY
jgi:hypothetical protein